MHERGITDIESLIKTHLLSREQAVRHAENLARQPDTEEERKLCATINHREKRGTDKYKATSKLFNALVDDGIAPEIRRSYSYTNIEAAQPVPVKEDIAVTMEAEELSSVAGLRIALTGNFECCSRAEVETALAQMGAKLTNSISSKTNYLIVGGLGSDRWKYNNGGGKIQQAAQLGVKILPETAISGLLKEAQNV